MTTPNPEPKLEQRHFEALERLNAMALSAFEPAMCAALAELPAILRALVEENARLRESLRFYAIPVVYMPDSIGRVPDLTDVARNALEEIAPQAPACNRPTIACSYPECGEGCRHRAETQAPAVGDDMVLVPRDLVRFLLGEAQLNDIWFGAKSVGDKHNFWWRANLRAAMNAATTKEPRHGE